MQGGGGGTQNKRERRGEGRDGDGEPLAWRCHGELSSWRGAAAIAITAVAMVRVRVAVLMRDLADRQRVEERDEGNWRCAKERGGQSTARHMGIQIAGGTRGQQ
jgi:hypothetical protein